MRKLLGLSLGLLLATGLSTTAAADNVAHCEVLIIQVIADAALDGEAQVVTYGSAVSYIESVYDNEDGHITHVADQPIRALMCNLNDVIPAESDYALIATGIPFILSQDFDSADTDSLTMFWRDGKLDYVYKGYPLSSEAQEILDGRIASFSKDGLNATALDAAAKAQAKQAEADADASEVEDVVVTKSDAKNETDKENKPDTESTE